LRAIREHRNLIENGIGQEKFMLRLSKHRHFWILLLLFAACLLAFKLVLNKLQMCCGTTQIPDTVFHYTPQQLYRLFQTYGTVGKKWYLIAMGIDLIYPLVYANLLSSVLTFLVGRVSTKDVTRCRLCVLPFAAAFADYVENGLQIYLLLRFPAQVSAIALFSAWVTTTKWLLIYSTFLVILVLSGRIVARRIKGSA